MVTNMITSFVASAALLSSSTLATRPRCLCRPRPRLPRAPPRARRAHLRASADDSGTSPAGGPSDGEQAPDGKTITAALEVTFRAVWVRLLTTGVGEEYAGAIQAFAVACAAAYKAGYSMTALQLELSTREPTGTVGGRDVRLTENEKETRLIWIGLVYMTLARFRFPSTNPPPAPERDLAGARVGEVVRGLAVLVEDVVGAARRGYTHKTYQMENSLVESKGAQGAGANLDAVEGKSKYTVAEQQLRSQWTRIVFATIDLLPDDVRRMK